MIREVPFNEALIRGIWEIYNEYPIRQGRKFLHYGKDIDTVRREEATYLENSQFIGAFDGEKLIGFVKIVVDESGTQAGLMNILSMIEYRDKAPTNALVAHAVRYCASRCISHLAYSSFAYGKRSAAASVISRNEMDSRNSKFLATTSRLIRSVGARCGLDCTKDSRTTFPIPCCTPFVNSELRGMAEDSRQSMNPPKNARNCNPDRENAMGTRRACAPERIRPSETAVGAWGLA